VAILSQVFKTERGERERLSLFSTKKRQPLSPLVAQGVFQIESNEWGKRFKGDRIAAAIREKEIARQRDLVPFCSTKRRWWTSSSFFPSFLFFGESFSYSFSRFYSLAKVRGVGKIQSSVVQIINCFRFAFLFLQGGEGFRFFPFFSLDL